MGKIITIQTDRSVVSYDKEKHIFFGTYGKSVIQNCDLFKELAPVVRIPFEEKQRIAHEFVKLSEFEIVLLMEV